VLEGDSQHSGFIRWGEGDVRARRSVRAVLVVVFCWSIRKGRGGCSCVSSVGISFAIFVVGRNGMVWLSSVGWSCVEEEEGFYKGLGI
jgi:hypothetical protein